ncbi:MAG: TonB-dependent receptor [Sphingomonadales bacterium]|nr:TonB-dependent receptor [Sphingomonadales bacterium]
MILAALAASPACAQDADGDDGPGKPVTEIIINARRLDAARANILPGIGAASYALSNDTVESRPGGETGTISQILLQAPGVAQDGSGRLRVRQSQGALQYRINNVILPDGLTDLGESLSPRIAANVELVTGALPAQYGLNTGAVVNVTTKDGVYLDGGQAEMYGGSHGELEPAFEYGGSSGSTNYFVSGSYLRHNVGLPAPDGSADPLHDRTRQIEGLAYLDHVIGAQTRVALILGFSDERFQIPNRRGLDARSADIGPVPFQRPLVVDGTSSFASEARDANRRERNRYGVLSVQHSTDRLTVQVAGFLRHSEANLAADGVGELLFTGVGRTSRETVDSVGLQVESVFELAEAHTLRAGGTLVSDIHRGNSQTTALPIDASGVQLGSAVLHFAETTRVAQRKDGLFVSDEWRPGGGVTINLGGRIDHVGPAGELTRFSPRAGLVWQPQPETKLHLGYARYVLPAPIDTVGESAKDLAATTARLPSATGNAALPERDDYLDLGVQHDAGDLRAALDLYWRRARDGIQEGIFGAAGQMATFNVGEARVRGAELSLTYSAGRLSAWGNLAIARARVRGITSGQVWFTPAQLAYAAGHWFAPADAQAVTMSGGLSYRFQAIRLSADMLYGSGLRRTLAGGDPNGAHLPGYVQVNASAVWRVATIRQRPLDLRLDIVNALDRRYALADGSALGASLPQWGARRGVFAGIEQAF